MIEKGKGSKNEEVTDERNPYFVGVKIVVKKGDRLWK